MGIPAARIRYLMTLLSKQEEGTSVTELAGLFGVAKSTISRAMDAMEEEGLVRKDTMSLTPYGRGLAREYVKRHALLTDWLCGCHGADREAAVQDAFAMLSGLSESTLDGLIHEIEAKKALYACLERTNPENADSFAIPGESLPEDGEYPVWFTFYRAGGQREKLLSMADEGFCHSGILLIREGYGLIRLETASRRGESRVQGLMLEARTAKLAYYTKEGFRQARQEDCFYYIPAKELRWKGYRQEKRILGVITVRIRVSISEEHMPESEAVLAVEIK